MGLKGGNVFSAKYTDGISFCIFFLISVLLLTEVAASVLHFRSIPAINLAIFGFFIFVALYDSFWAICIFIAVVPLISGLNLTTDLNDSFYIGFSGLFLGWFSKRVFYKRSLNGNSLGERLADILIAIVLLNLLFFIIRILELPFISKEWLKWFCFFPYSSQNGILWQITASLVLIKGLCFYKMICLEVIDASRWKILIRMIFLHVAVIVPFSLLQVAGVIERKYRIIKINMPFDDVHSYASYIAFLLIFFFLLAVFSFQYLRAIKMHYRGGQVIPSWLQAEEGGSSHWKLISYFLLALMFTGLLVVSYSRMAWISAFIVGSAAVMILLLKKSKILFITVLFATVLSIFAGVQYSDNMIKSGDYSIKRFGSILNIDNYLEDRDILARYELWNRAQHIISEYPLTGTGPGSFYRVSRNFVDNQKRWQGYQENAHNYYLQVFAELGVPFGVVFCLLLLTGIRQGFFPKEKPEDRFNRTTVIALTAGLSAYLATMLSGHPLLLVNQQFLFWFIVALIATSKQISVSHTPQQDVLSKIITGISLCMFALFLTGFLMDRFGHKYNLLPPQYGLYAQENWDGKNIHWTAGKAKFYVSPESGVVSLFIHAAHYNSSLPTGLTLKVSLNDTLVDSVKFLNGGEKTLKYRPQEKMHAPVKVELEADRVFSMKQLGLSEDSRKLGVAIGYN